MNMTDLQKKLHAYARRTEHILHCFDRAYSMVGVNPTALEEELLRITIDLELLCRNARRLLLQTSVVKKETLIAQACSIREFEIEERDNAVHITLPILPLKKTGNANCSYITDPLMWCLQKYHEENPPHKYDKARITVCHCFPQEIPTRQIRDLDNIEVKKVLDVLAMYYLIDDNMAYCEILHTARPAEVYKTEITIADWGRNV